MIISKKDIKKSLSTIPNKPGCYLYKNESEKVIYVGKAKKLQKRISSYFQKTIDNAKTRALLREFQTIEYMIVETEHDALLLEYNLIRQHQPKYNILLKAGNRYLSICIKDEPFPRVFATHKVIQDGSKYYGPYPSAGMAWALVQLFRDTFKIRTCRLDLQEEKINAGKFRICLQYHIKRCKGPCEGHQSEDNYDNNITKIRRILRGDIREVREALEEEMTALAADLRFEEAQEKKEMIDRLDSYQGKSTINSEVVGNAIVASCDSDLSTFYFNYLELKGGQIISGRTMEYKKQIDEDVKDLFSSVLQEVLQNTQQKITELILPFEPEYALEKGQSVTIPQRGDRRKLLDLSISNVRQYITDKQKQSEKLNPEQRKIQILKDLQNTIGLPTLPYHIECFDNSNISGSDPVAACVVFKGGKPDKSSYRHYHIKSVTGPDDYASMQEVILRRYTKTSEENPDDLPDLIITDGGKGHMSSVKEALSSIDVSIPILGLAKDDKHKTANILFGDPPEIIGIMSRSSAFHLLENIQNEVHRFAITFHRKMRSKRQTKSVLDDIKGVGEATKKKLLSHFKSIKRIKAANQEEIEAIIGKSKAILVINSLKTKEE